MKKYFISSLILMLIVSSRLSATEITQNNIEEGWRWRRTLNFNLDEGSVINADIWHDNKAQTEYDISSKLVNIANTLADSDKSKLTFGRKNIILAKVKLLFKRDDSSDLIVLEDELKEILRNQRVGQKTAVFISGARTIDDQNLNESYNFYTVNKLTTRQELKKDLELLFERNDSTHFIRINNTEISRRKNEVGQNRDFETHYYHSEQVLRVYLQKYMDHIVKDILEQKKELLKENDILNTVIIQLHSRLDLCSRCSQSLFKQSEGENGFLDQPTDNEPFWLISSKIKKTIMDKRYQVPNSQKNGGGIQFLILASSRETYIKENRRHASSHDGNFLSSSLNINDFLPCCAQKIIEPFKFDKNNINSLTKLN